MKEQQLSIMDVFPEQYCSEQYVKAGYNLKYFNYLKFLKEVEKWEKMPLSSDRLFTSVFQSNKELLKELIQLMMGKEIAEIGDVYIEKSLSNMKPFRSVRLDVVFRGEVEVYNIELQTAIDKKSLAKRLRYYQSMIDMKLLPAGEDYIELINSYIIFLCMDTPFNDGHLVHKFTDRSDVNGMELNTGAYKIVYSMPYFNQEGNKILKSFFNYLTTGIDDKEGGDFMQILKDTIDVVKENNPDSIKEKYMFEIFKEMDYNRLVRKQEEEDKKRQEEDRKRQEEDRKRQEEDRKRQEVISKLKNKVETNSMSKEDILEALNSLL
ncbi:MAG: hypothetical protein R3Y29_03605 [bacterium]